MLLFFIITDFAAWGEKIISVSAEKRSQMFSWQEVPLWLKVRAADQAPVKAKPSGLRCHFRA